MTAPALRPSWVTATLTCAFFGFITYIMFWPLTFDFQDIEMLPDSYVLPRTAYLLMQLPAGIVSIAGLPFVLRGTRNERPSQYVVATVTISLGTFGCLGVYAGLLAIIELASRRSIRWAALASAAGICGTALSLSADPDKSSIIPAFGLSCVVIVICLLIGINKGKRREAAAAAWQEAQLSARHDERLRVARDMHDSLTHRLSLISVHAGVLELRQDLDAEARAREAATIRQQAAEAVADLQDVLSVLRTEPESVDPRQSVTEMVAQARNAGMDLTLDIDPKGAGKLAKLSTTAQHTVHRMLQESLTNARKHAHGAPVHIRVSGAEGLRVSVSNPGPAAPGPSGVGLIGLRERAELSGGSLTVTTDPFTVSLDLP
ncbi:sensor histidine kinase [Corynebacterium epidermidicanis]|uniref:histidine kinase n=1 Tax=Corynebacterium epidermidicanis TaxID=1050174 RepID=A0A0G3GX48_9CORY|nr:histidine kinase [Corynebacterium epidermidicanis]AKK03437.1 signal transduction histidine kinase [Corynebacterium epidermidicanis]